TARIRDDHAGRNRLSESTQFAGYWSGVPRLGPDVLAHRSDLGQEVVTLRWDHSTLAKVLDHAHDPGPLVGRHCAPTDLDRNLGAGFVAPDELTTLTYEPRPRSLLVFVSLGTRGYLKAN